MKKKFATAWLYFVGGLSGLGLLAIITVFIRDMGWLAFGAVVLVLGVLSLTAWAAAEVSK